MQFTHLFATGLLSGFVSALPAHVRRGVECSYSTAANSGSTCESFSSNWGISVDDLKNLNPGINCSELDPNELYCVIGTVTDDPPTSSSTAISTTTDPSSTTTSQAESTPPSATIATSTKSDTVPATTTTSAGNGVTTPQPTQPGMVSNCAKFHYVAKTVSCSQVISYEKITLADFVRWNPTVLDDCSGMWAEVNVCVGVIGQVTTTTLQPSTTIPVGNGVQTPRPTQPGMVTNCAKFHWVGQDVTCSQIVSYEHITLDEFAQWNPTVGKTCSNMQAGVNVCVGLIGGTTTTVKPTPTTTGGSGVQTPQPTQPGMVTNCKKFHFVADGVTCSQILSYEKITLADFAKWNTGVGSDCKTMWTGVNVCVGV